MNRCSSSGYPIDELGTTVSRTTLEGSGLEVSNVVGTLYLDFEPDLTKLSRLLTHSEYTPDNYQNLIYNWKSDSSTRILVLPSGCLIVVGSKNKADLIDAVTDFLAELSDSGYVVQQVASGVFVQNILATGDLDREVDLSAVLLDLGLEKAEYEPATFPGLFFKTTEGTTITLYRTGKFTIGGSKCYKQVLDSYTELIDRLPMDFSESQAEF